eukprot:jgi/Psemu1/291301/fgenesh1_pg.665_\
MSSTVIFQTLQYVAPDQVPQSANLCFGTCPSGTMVAMTGATFGYVAISYDIRQALQKSYHPNPNIFHPRIQRTAYLPDTAEGRDILLRFQYAFLHGLCFQVGRSLAWGLDNQVTWSHCLPHKTNTVGGPPSFGFPDPSYLSEASTALDLLNVPNDPQLCRQWILQDQSLTPSLGMATQAWGVPHVAYTQNNHPRAQNETIYYDADTMVDNSVDRYNQYLEPIANSNNGEEVDECLICLEDMVLTPSASTTSVVCLKLCKHRFHKVCIIETLKQKHTKCPYCREPIGVKPHGPGPSGRLDIQINASQRCSGFEHDSDAVIALKYSMPGGTQTAYMENPGHRYDGTIRTAYLPHNEPGRALLKRLKYAFAHGLTFRVGTSLTSGRQNQITWTSIHHKTSLNYGAHGYPDPRYFANCNEALDALRVPKGEDCT